MKAWAVAFAVLAGCSKPSEQSASVSSVRMGARGVPSSPPTAVAAASESPAAPSASAAPTPGPCMLASGYRGEVAGQPVFARVGKVGKGVRGRYFYERVGTDIALEGTLTDAGALAMTEKTGGKGTGAFDGTCDGAGVITGSWKAGTKTATFELDPVPQRDLPVLAKKRYTYSAPSPNKEPGGVGHCSYKEERDEVFGLRNPAAEPVLNGQGLDVLLGPVLDAEEAKGVRSCDTGVEVEMTRTLTAPFRDLATLETGGYSMMDGAAHPTNFLGFDRHTVDLRTGDAVTSGEVFAHDPGALVAKCIAKVWHDESFSAEMIAGYFGGGFDLTEKGAHFFGAGYPHVIGALTGQGPTIGYGVLLRDGYLEATSPVARAWAGVAPAAKDVDACDEATVGWP